MVYDRRGQSMHIFLEGKNKGMNNALRGNIAFCYILVDDIKEKWKDKEEQEAIQTIRETSSWFMQEAKKRGVPLTIRNLLFHSTLALHVDLKTPTLWADHVLQSLKFSSVKAMHDAFVKEKGFDDVAIIYLFRHEERSFAQQQTSMGDGREYATVFYGTAGSELIHEICHLFGACDFYYTSFVKEKVKRYLGGSVMCDTSLYIDDVTAYTIGWLQELTDNARVFLEETSHITKQDWNQALNSNTKSGRYKTNMGDGYSYAGDLVNGVRHGKGVLHYPTGDVYQGEFKHGNPEGMGKLTYSSGAVYSGEFKNGQPEGLGKLKYANGSVYSGKFQAGRPQGEGVLNFTNGDRYEGAFVEGLFEGKGTYYFHTGQKKKGVWKKGEYWKRF